MYVPRHKKIEEKIAVLVQLLGSVEYIHLKLLQGKMGFHRFTKNFQNMALHFSLLIVTTEDTSKSTELAHSLHSELYCETIFDLF